MRATAYPHIVTQLARWTAVGLLMLCAVPRILAADVPELEWRVKAAYLYRFAGHVEWPAAAFRDAEAPLTIAVAGADELLGELTKLKGGKPLADRALDVRAWRGGDSLSGVQIFFVGRQDAKTMQRALDSARNLPVLVVTDADGALTLGSIINFLLVENRVRFEVSLGQAERSGLKVSSRLLAVAQRVQGGRTP